MKRSTLDTQLNECPQCGFIGANLDFEIQGAKEIIKSASFLAMGAEAHTPKLARQFAKHSLLRQDDPKAAAISLLSAAWVCDDACESERAKSFRNQAAEAILALNLKVEEEVNASILMVLVDIVRRVERFEEARELATSLSSTNAFSRNQTLLGILNYQCRLCDDHDTDCHTLAEVA